MQRAIQLTAPGAPFVLGTRPIPRPKSGELLVKILTTAINPCDLYMQARGYPGPIPKPWPNVCGWDAAGVVEEIGEGVQGFVKGDRVMYSGDFDDDRYTFQEYGITVAATTAKISSGLSLEEAATFSTGLYTAASGLYGERATEHRRWHGGAGLVAPWDGGGRGMYKDEPIIITGGAGSVGQFAIQLAKLSGFNPIITTASAHNEAYCKSAGATHVIDYRTTPYSSLSSVVSSILLDTFGDAHKPIKTIFDTVSIAETNIACWSILASGGTLIITLPPSKEIGNYGLGAEKNQDGKSNDTLGDVRLGERLFGALDKMISEEDLMPNRLEVLEGGLSAIEGAARRMEGGGVSGLKLVVRVPDTPSL
ncbi:GroES-like protein [Stereum hirsutum FP-91666 SS1]|uniref:GroES-like protein n=1 Tax=Stereum hirsutum (strain FP-91666) TaxID=721885 RepID=UPI000440C817|nr:GroES-like protein [Stereum hirsutum FP-91666 SS1]EIM90574.1 GroES-like protein [Stereum hirsutum FP-91666 SS1]